VLLAGQEDAHYQEQALVFWNVEPGPGALILQTDPLNVVLPIVWASSMTGLTKDTSRTAKEITATLSEYLTQKGVPTQTQKNALLMTPSSTNPSLTAISPPTSDY